MKMSSLTGVIPGGHSAKVEMRLLLNGHVLRIAQLGPEFLILEDGVEHPATDGEIVMQVDGAERRWRVRLPEGIAVGVREIRTVSLESAA